MTNAKFWQRILASLADNLICLLTAGVLAGFTGYVLGFSLPDTPWYIQQEIAYGSGFGLFLLMRWLYFTLFSASDRKATPGKQLLRIQVTDMEGGRISFWRASARYWSKILSTLIIGGGFIMAAFTKNKQGLHDLIAGTRVLKTR